MAKRLFRTFFQNYVLLLLLFIIENDVAALQEIELGLVWGPLIIIIMRNILQDSLAFQFG